MAFVPSNRLNVNDPRLDARVMLAAATGGQLVPAEAPLSEGTTVDEISQSAPDIYSLRIEDLPSIAKAPRSLSVPAGTTTALQSLFQSSVEDQTENLTSFDVDGNELPTTVTGREFARVTFFTPPDAVFQAHTHPLTAPFPRLGFESEGGLSGGVPHSYPDLAITLRDRSSGQAPGLRGTFVQADGLTYFAALTAEAPFEAERSFGDLVEAAAVGGDRAFSEASELATDPDSPGGVATTLQELAYVRTMQSVYAANELGIVLYRGVTGLEADGTTRLEKVDSEISLSALRNFEDFNDKDFVESVRGREGAIALGEEEEAFERALGKRLKDERRDAGEQFRRIQSENRNLPDEEREIADQQVLDEIDDFFLKPIRDQRAATRST